MQRLRARIMVAREQAQLSQAELERELALPSGAISKIESGARDVSSIELAAIAQACGKSLNWFFEKDDQSVLLRAGNVSSKAAREDLAWFNEFADAFVALKKLVDK